jgi:4-hydroxy-tetrahydrodipicolinate synthase
MNTPTKQGDWGQVLTAMVTPFTPDLKIDVPGVARVVNHLLDNGSDGLIVCGTTGESPTLSAEEKLQMFRLVKEAANGRGVVIAGTGGNNTAETLELSRRAQETGVDGLLLVAPYYNKPSQEGLYQHFRTIAEVVSLPIMLYNVPPRTAVNIDAATALRLAQDVPNIVSVKEASGNLMQVSEIAANAPEGFKVYSGDDGLALPLLSLGGAGVVSVTAHLVGREMKAMHTAFFAGRVAEAAQIHAQMLGIVKACFQPTTPSPAPVKAGLELLGIPAGGLRPPLLAADTREREIVAQALRCLGRLA